MEDDNIKLLGATIDSSLAFNKHVSLICQSCQYHIRALRHIRPILDANTAKLQFTDCDIEHEFEHIQHWSDEHKLFINKTKTVEIIFWRTRCKYVLPNLVEIQRVETVQLLGVFLTSNFTWSEHIAYIQRVITQKFYLLKQIKNMSLNTSSMNDVFKALVLSQIQYALPVYYGHLLQADKNRIDASLRKAKRWGLTTLDVHIDSLGRSADQTLFAKVMKTSHCLHRLLPPKTENSHYSLRSNLVQFMVPLIQNNNLLKSFIFISIKDQNSQKANSIRT